MKRLKEFLKRFLESRGWYVRKLKGLAYGVCFREDISKIYGLDKVRVVFDVGAHHGQTARLFAETFSRAEIISFEPTTDSFRTLQANTRSEARIKAMQMALGETCGQQAMALHDYSQINSLKPELNRIEQDGRSEIVSVRTADSVRAELRLEAIDLLKIDAEGYEMSVLAGASDCLKQGKVALILAEATLRPRDQEHTQMGDLIEVLDQYGFDIVAIYDQAVLDRRYLGFVNALFMRRGIGQAE